MSQLQKHGLFVGIGVVVWFSFLVLIRLLGPAVFSPGNPMLIALYVAAFPMVVVTVFAVQALTRVPMREMVTPVVVITITALLLDGIAVGFTDWYGATDGQVRASAAFLLWGGGAGLLAALWLAERAGRNA